MQNIHYFINILTELKPTQEVNLFPLSIHQLSGITRLVIAVSADTFYVFDNHGRSFLFLVIRFLKVHLRL